MNRRDLLSGVAALAATMGIDPVEAVPVLAKGEAVAQAPTVALTTVALTSPNTGTLPFSFGAVFKKGAVPSGTGIVTDATSSQVVVTRSWNDGSAKHAVISGTQALTANTTHSVNVSAGTPPTAAKLTATNIQKASPIVIANLGTAGTVDLSSLLSSPTRTWVGGPEMVECQYMTVSSGGVLVIFYVRLWKSGQMHVRVSMENGWVDRTNIDKSYMASISIGGLTVFSGSITHYANTRWTAKGWIGGDPAVTAAHNTPDMIATKLIPNYFMQRPSEAVLSGLVQTYTPMNQGPWPTSMGTAGFGYHIGLMPNWDALFITSLADARAYNAVIAASEAYGCYAIVWRGHRDNDLPCRPSAYPIFNTSTGQFTSGQITWEQAHHPEVGYLAYMITGEYFHLETMQHNAVLQYVCYHSGRPGTGTGTLISGQTRGYYWAHRTIGFLDALGPLDSLTMDYQALLSTQIEDEYTTATTAGVNPFGILYDYDLWSAGYSTNESETSPWQHAFGGQSLGMLVDIEPLASMTHLSFIAAVTQQMVINMLGDGVGGNYCFNYAADYNLAVGPGPTVSFTTFPTPWDIRNTPMYTTWTQVATKQASLGTGNNLYGTCDNTLKGFSGGDPAGAPTGYWGNLMPSIAYAVDHGVAGASAAWNRMTGATNWSVILRSGFSDIPIWGIRPRS